METLDNPIRNYAWGSDVVLAAWQGRPCPSEKPEAEVWIGAHPLASSTVLRDGSARSLSDVVTAAPAVELGPDRLAEFGPRLPYLAKMLAAARSLSIQVHPDSAQAALGHAAELAAARASDIPWSREDHSYVDPFGKPEILVARTPFELLSGFRPVTEAARALERLGVSELSALAARIVDADGLRAVFAELLYLAEPADLVERVATACTNALVRERRAGHHDGDNIPHDEHTSHDELIPRLAKQHSGDAGVLVALLLNHAVLPPGAAVFTAPGTPHAYLSGTGFEVMGSSDNVLRGGLTYKKIDIAELLRLVRVEPGPMAMVTPVNVAAGLRQWQVPVSEFVLFGVDVNTDDRPAALAPPPGWAAGGSSVARVPVRPDVSGPCLVVCDSGVLTCRDAASEVTLRQGQAAYSGATAGQVEIAGAGTAFVVASGLESASRSTEPPNL